MHNKTPTGKYIKNYRGYDIYEDGSTNFSVWRAAGIVTRCGTAWSCVCYIDELCSY